LSIKNRPNALSKVSFMESRPQCKYCALIFICRLHYNWCGAKPLDEFIHGVSEIFWYVCSASRFCRLLTCSATSREITAAKNICTEKRNCNIKLEEPGEKVNLLFVFLSRLGDGNRNKKFVLYFCCKDTTETTEMWIGFYFTRDWLD
jgi:hypothetical protein